jgi:hypothetical protein
VSTIAFLQGTSSALVRNEGLMNRYAYILLAAAVTATVTGCESPHRTRNSEQPLVKPASFAAATPAAPSALTPFPQLTGPSNVPVPLNPAPGIGALGLAPINPLVDLGGMQFQPAEPPQPQVAAEPAPGPQLPAQSLPASQIAAPDYLPQQPVPSGYAAQPAYEPVYAPQYEQQYTPQVIVVQQQPQVIVQEYYYPYYPIFQSYFAFDWYYSDWHHDHGHYNDYCGIDDHDHHSRSRPAVIVGQPPRNSSSAQPLPAPVTSAPGGKMTAARPLVNNFAAPAGEPALSPFQSAAPAARQASSLSRTTSTPTRSIVAAPSAQRAPAVPLAQPAALQPVVARPTTKTDIADDRPPIPPSLPTKTIVAGKSLETARSAPRLETSTPVRTNTAPPALRAPGNTEKTTAPSKPLLVNKSEAGAKPVTPGRSSDAPSIVLPTRSLQPSPSAIKPIAPTASPAAVRAQPSAAPASPTPVVRSAPAIRSAPTPSAAPARSSSSGGSAPIIPSKGAALNRSR